MWTVSHFLWDELWLVRCHKLFSVSPTVIRCRFVRRTGIGQDTYFFLRFLQCTKGPEEATEREKDKEWEAGSYFQALGLFPQLFSKPGGSLISFFPFFFLHHWREDHKWSSKGFFPYWNLLWLSLNGNPNNFSCSKLISPSLAFLLAATKWKLPKTFPVLSFFSPIIDITLGNH